MLWYVFSVCLLPTSCRLSYQLLQLLLHKLCYRWNLRVWILGKLRGEALIGDESFAYTILVHCQPQWSIQGSFWRVFDHLDGKQRVANRILGSSRGFSSQGEQGSLFDLTEDGKTAWPKLLFDLLRDLLPGCIGGDQFSRNFIPVCSQAQLRFKSFNHLFIRSVCCNNNVLAGN